MRRSMAAALLAVACSVNRPAIRESPQAPVARPAVTPSPVPGGATPPEPQLPPTPPPLPVPAFEAPRGYEAVLGPGFAFAIEPALAGAGAASFRLERETPEQEAARFGLRVAWDRFHGDALALRAREIDREPDEVDGILSERAASLGALPAHEVEWRGSAPESEQAIERFAVQSGHGFDATCDARRDSFESVRALCVAALDRLGITAVPTSLPPATAVRGPGFMVVPPPGFTLRSVSASDPRPVRGLQGLPSFGISTILLVEPFSGTLADLAEETLRASSIGIVERLRQTPVRIAGHDALELESILPGQTPPEHALLRLVLVDGRATTLTCSAGADVYSRFRARCRAIVESLLVAP